MSIESLATARANRIRRALWGGLMHHHQECPECSGTGCEDPDDDDTEPCPTCDGHGKLFWGSFYGQRGECEWCEREKLTCWMFDGGEREWICLRCYLDMHRHGCGCDLWKNVEAHVRWPQPQEKSA